MGNKNNGPLQFSRHDPEDVEKEPDHKVNTEFIQILKEIQKFPYPSFDKSIPYEKINLSKNNISKILVKTNEEKEILKHLSTSLKYLILSDNPLQVIPEEFGEFFELEELILSSSKLEGLPKSLSGLTKLKTLDVFLNRLQNIDLKGLENLSKLLLSWNYLKTIDVADFPHNLDQCTVLRDLKLRFNKIRAVPETILISTLTKLNLSHNFISQLPESLEKLENLVELKLDHNEITVIPLLPPNVQKVDLHVNKIKSFVFPFSKPNKTLENINLSSNEISDLTDLSDLLALTYLDLGSNKIKDLPSKWPANLDEIYLGNNLIEEISEFSAPKLRALFLSENKIKTVPSRFFLSHKSLRTLSLAKNQIAEMEDIPNTDSCKLENLFLGFNQIREFPKNFFHLYASLSVLDFSYNQISSVPSELQNMSFNHLHMNGNLISETSMEVLMELSTMYLYLSDNKFTVTLDKDEFDFEEGLKSETDLQIAAGHAEMCGMRPSFEDSYVLEINFQPNRSMFAVFDGHGGALGAKRAAETLMNIFDSVSKDDISVEKVLQLTFQELEKQVCDASFKNVEGATATVVYIHNDMIYSANLGDSRSILVSKNKVEQLSYEHKGYDRQEHDRVRESGGFITENDRIQGIIGVPRSLGDKGLKKYLSSDPYIISRKMTKEDEYCVIACDGVWDVLSNEAVAELLDPTLSCGHNARRIRDCAFSLSSTDNISCVVVNLKLLNKFE